MTTTSAKPNDWRRVLRHHILRATFGRIDNRTLIRDNAQLRPHQATATEGNGSTTFPARRCAATSGRIAREHR
jgi:hypothetical protein